MAQILIRNVDDRDLETLRARARAQRTSVEALGREAIRRAAQLTVDEKRALVADMQRASKAAMVPGMPQTSGLELIREDRDHDH